MSKLYNCRYAAVITLSVALYACSDDTIEHSGNMTTERNADTFWETDLPETQGVDSGILAAMFESEPMTARIIHSVLIVRNGYLVLEHYTHPYTRDTLYNIKSVSKSLLSALVGIAQDEGTISPDAPIGETFPEYISADDTEKMGITMRHLLTMSAGLDIDDEEMWDEVRATDDWLGNVLGRPMTDTPGNHFRYSSGLTHVAGALLARKTDMSLFDFARVKLFEPMGIEQVQWRIDPQGYYYGGCDVFLRPLDMAKLGALYADGGRFEGEQIVPEKWVHASTAEAIETDVEPYSYGYWWWLDADGWFLARGWGGQRIAVNPAEQTVIVITASIEAYADELLAKYLRPALRSQGPLAPNPAAVTLLSDSAERLSEPTAYSPSPNAVPAEVSGKRYQFEPNSLGITALTTTWDDPVVGQIRIEREEGESINPVGMDDRYRISPLAAGGMEGSPPVAPQAALRGFWSDNVLYVDYLELGNPLQLNWTLTFGVEEGTLDLTVYMVSTFDQMELHAVEEQ